MPQVSKVAQMPGEIRAWLHKAFVARGFGEIEAITDEVNALMKEAGVAITIGKSAVGMESQRVRRAQESIAATTRHMQLIADTAPDEADKRGEALNAMVSEGLFNALLYAREAESEEDPNARISLMNKAALASARLTMSSVKQRQFRNEVDARAKTAAEAVGKLLKKGGMDAKTAAEIRRSILGITKREPAEPAPGA